MRMARQLGKIVSDLYKSLFFPPFVIAVAILIATNITWHSARQSLNHDIQTAVNTRIASAEQSIRSTMNSYEEILRGGVGLFQGSNEVTRTDFAHYLQAFNLTNNYNAVQGIGYAKIVTADQLPNLQEYMTGQGVSDFTVHPQDPAQPDYAPVMYVQTVASKAQPTYGFDMYSEPARQAAMYRARDTMTTTITSRITLLSSDAKGSLMGFNMYVPHYDPELPLDTVAERQAAIRGYVLASFRASVFFAGIARSTSSETAAFRIAVADDPAHDLYRSANFEGVNKQQTIRVTRDLKLYGETWHIEYIFDRHGIVSDVQLRRPGSVLFAGIFTSALIALVVLLLLRSRTQELATQKEQAVDLAKDELLSLASHQLRTPATGVKQYLGMVLQGFAGRVSRSQLQLLEKAYSSNERQLSIINEILSLAKIESGRIVLARQETNLNGLIEDIVTEQRPDIEKAQHHITLRLPRRPLAMRIDAHTLRMAIENILSNAIKYTPDGGDITIRLRHDGFHVYITVKDNGVGIAGGDIDQLFKQFSRLPNEMSLKVGGTGIGLYLAKHLVELHGGHITVKSSPKKGSSFTIVLPWA